LDRAESQNDPMIGDPADRQRGLDAETLFRRHGPTVWSVCLAHAKNVQDSEDIMQEVFLKVFSGLSMLRDPDRARGWLLQITRRTCIDYLRRQTATLPIPEDLPAAPKDEVQDRIATLHRAISRLPEGLREPITLFYLNGHSSASVARTLGISETAARSRLARARLRLHVILTEDER
jgi:RNA polymerase sigma-70 factor, ECF subfamily